MPPNGNRRALRRGDAEYKVTRSQYRYRHDTDITLQCEALSMGASMGIRIGQDDLIQSVADALQYISYYHPVDFIRGLARAYEMEQSPAAKDAIEQIPINSRMAAEGHRPMCQDTGIVPSAFTFS